MLLIEEFDGFTVGQSPISLLLMDRMVADRIGVICIAFLLLVPSFLVCTCCRRSDVVGIFNCSD